MATAALGTLKDQQPLRFLSPSLSDEQRVRILPPAAAEPWNSSMSEEGLRMILSPVQLAAVVQGEHLGAHEIMTNRLWGGVKLLGGALEFIGGGALVLTPEPTMLTKAGGWVLLVHGADTLTSGARELWTGEAVKTVTQQAAEAVARGLGANEQNAERTGVIIDFAVPLAAASLTAAARILEVRLAALRWRSTRPWAAIQSSNMLGEQKRSCERG